LRRKVNKNLVPHDIFFLPEPVLERFALPGQGKKHPEEGRFRAENPGSNRKLSKLLRPGTQPRLFGLLR
jgi:hypothetical protein